MEIHFTVFSTPLGWMGLVGGEKGLRRVYLPEPSREALLGRIEGQFPGIREGERFVMQAKREIEEYFQGSRTEFEMPLDLSAATPFQQKVYRAMRAVPFGQVRTYRWLAEEIGNPKGLRAVGGANARNHWPLVVPCHRIVGTGGRLTGFSAPGGLALKEALLKLEGAPVEKGRAVSNAEFGMRIEE